jgi:hypothetical protein
MSAIESPVADSIYDTANLDKNGRIVDEITTNCPVAQYRAMKQFREFACIFSKFSQRKQSFNKFRRST